MIIGIPKPKLKDLANELPTNNEPNKPGPLVKATADI